MLPAIVTVFVLMVIAGLGLLAALAAERVEAWADLDLHLDL